MKKSRAQSERLRAMNNKDKNDNINDINEAFYFCFHWSGKPFFTYENLIVHRN
jgi:hypothetical protein